MTIPTSIPKNSSINTWLLEREGTVYAGGTPGADTQIQVNLQAITAIADWGLGAQSAIDSPKWAITSHAGRRLITVLPGDGLVLESRFPTETAAELDRRGHGVVQGSAWETALSRMQIVARQSDGALAAASDLRAEGAALGVELERWADAAPQDPLPRSLLAQLPPQPL